MATLDGEAKTVDGNDGIPITKWGKEVVVERKEIIHRWEESEPKAKIKLIKLVRGYNWEITYENSSNEKLLEEIESLNNALLQRYGEQTPKPSD